jgi:phosphoglycolate phosphatase-like HAD superfamily hydrolase
MKSCVIFDLDGTIANTNHRQHFLEKTPKDWQSFFNACSEDAPIDFIIRLMQALTNHHIIICTGRPSSHRSQTVSWLMHHCVPWSVLHMRAAGDLRSDHVVKKEMLDNLRSAGIVPWLAVDDRPSVIAMWRSNGVPCLAMDSAAWANHPVERDGSAGILAGEPA